MDESSWTPVQWLLSQLGGSGGATAPSQFGPPTPPGFGMPQYGPELPLGALFDPTGGMTPQDYANGPNVGGPGAALPTTSTPTSAQLPQAGNFGGSPETNPLLKPLGSPAGGANSFLEALKGVQIPKPPAAQTVHTPSASILHSTPPRPVAAIKGGELLALLEMLNGSQAAQGGPKLPSTLGGALGGR